MRFMLTLIALLYALGAVLILLATLVVWPLA
jgi:hypothetical protein